jgi:quercetin dioxygenase-like cupin family protein
LADGFVLQPQETTLVWLRALGVRFLVGGEVTDGRCAIVEHPIPPKALAAPLHTHEREDEISFVIEGEVGLQLGDRTEIAQPGAVVFKPRGIPHTFWNASDSPARLLELITPAGFERYFEEMALVFADAAGGPPDAERRQALLAKYALQMDMESLPRLMQEHGLV